MDALLPNSDFIRAGDLYGKYKNIKEKTVRLYGDIRVQYFLLKGTSRDTGSDVFSILCAEYDGSILTDSEFIFDITSNDADAVRIYDIIYRNTVTPCCLFDVLDNVLYDLLN